MMVLKRAALAVIALILSGCAAGPAIFGPSTGTVAGHVTLRACGGASRIDQTGCRVSPAVDAQLTFVLSDGSQSTTATTDASGAYRVALKPGTYTARLELHASGSPSPAIQSGPTSRGYAGPKQVRVSAGQTFTADFTYTIELL